MQSWRLVGLLALSGCGQIFGLSSPVLDDTTTDAPVTDSTADTRADDSSINPVTCVQKWQAGPSLSTPTALGVNTNNDEQWPFVTADGLDLYFAKDGEVYLATRATTTVDFTNANRIGGLSSGSPEGKTFVSSNKLRAFFASSRAASSGGFDLFRGSRSSESNNFQVDQSYLGNVNSANNDVDPHLTGDLLHLYFSTVINATQVIVMSTRATIDDPFSAAVVVPGIAGSTGTDNGPTLTADELVIVFTSSRIASKGATNLWYATRTSKTDAFGVPKIVPTVNSDTFDDTPHLSADGCTHYFSTVTGASYDLYMSAVQ
jgi:hypothetical protein